MDERIDNGWDTYCSRTASGYLLRLAADTWERAGAKWTDPADRNKIEQRAHELIRIAKRVFDTEDSFAEVLGKTVGLDAEVIPSVVQLVKDRARPLRGQLGLFDKLGGA